MSISDLARSTRSVATGAQRTGKSHHNDGLRLQACCLFSVLLWSPLMAATAAALPGDAIASFTAVRIVPNPTDHWHWDLQLEVYYTYNPQHPRVIIGGYVTPHGSDLQTGHSYWGTSSGPNAAVSERREGSLISGMQRVNVAVRVRGDQFQTHGLELFMYEPGGSAFLRRTFSFVHTWRRPGGSTSSPAPGATSGPVAQVGDAREGGTPDFASLSLVRDDRWISVTLATYTGHESADRWGAMVSVYLYGSRRHHLMTMFDAFQLRLDSEGDSHFERVVYSGRPVRLSDGRTRLDVPRQYIPDIDSNRIWAFSQNSRDRIPDRGELRR